MAGVFFAFLIDIVLNFVHLHDSRYITDSAYHF